MISRTAMQHNRHYSYPNIGALPPLLLLAFFLSTVDVILNVRTCVASSHNVAAHNRHAPPTVGLEWPLATGARHSLWSSTYDGELVQDLAKQTSSQHKQDAIFFNRNQVSTQPEELLNRTSSRVKHHEFRKLHDPQQQQQQLLQPQHVIRNHRRQFSRIHPLAHEPPAIVDAAGHNHIRASRSLTFMQTSARDEANDNVETFYIRKGAKGSLPCLPVSPADSQATMNKIEWFKEEKKLAEAEAKRIVIWNTKNSIAYLPENGALLFHGVANEDSGEYHCVMTKSNGDSEDGVVRFYVQDVPDPPQMPIVTTYTQRTANLSWVPSYDYHYSPILHYVIHVRENVDGKWDVANGIMTPDNRTNYEIIGLKPFTTYSFRVLAVNTIGVGEPSPPSYYIVTWRQKPDSRLEITSAKNVSSTAIRIDWLRPSPEEIHGEFLGYRIRYVHQLLQEQHHFASNKSNRPLGPSPALTLDSPQAKEIIVGDTRETSYTIKNLQTYTPYKISVQVTNPAGDGPAAEVLAMTDEGVASAPLDLSVLKTTDTTVKLRWSEPKSPNGILQGYQITLHDIGNNVNDTRKLSDPQSVMEHTLSELNPFSWYLAHIQAYSRKFLGESSQAVKFRTDVSAPSQPQLMNVTCFPRDSILIQWQRPEHFHNQIDFYYVKYRQDSNSWTNKDNDEEETILSAKKDTLLNELLITNLTADQLYEIRVLAGTRSIHDPSQVYRSEPSQLVRVILQANCESYTAYPITENTFNTSLAIGVVCASFALALVTASLIVWRRHCQAAYYYLDEPQDQSRGTNSPQLSETYDDSDYGSTLVAEWAKHVAKLHADSDIGFSREFELIQQANQQNSALTCNHSKLAENKHKNRYINIVAYDHTRVILRPPLGGQKKPGFDYINANFIDGYNKPRAYIGTQGPLVSTFDDYWRMIWEQRVVIIVMITNLQERGRRKCDLYWPKEGSETYGYVQVKLLQEVVMATYTLRTFTVRNLKLKRRSAAERTVYQYHYTNWPDHGVPDHPLPVLSFVRKSAAANPPGAGAIICHCSAGCGRSGTYIVIDAMLKQIRHRHSINVVDFLKHIRTQRNYLVQTEEQYIFIHDSLVEAIESGETEIPSTFIAKYIQMLQTGAAAAASNQLLTSPSSSYSIGGQCQSPVSYQQQPAQANGEQQLLLVHQSNSQNNFQTGGSKCASQATTVSRSQSSGQWSLLERQYRLVASFKAKDFCVVSALKPCNKHKNRSLNLIPLEAHRVHITPKPGADGSDYINATFLVGFNHLREFIVTQHPVHETFSDFWQMVYDHNSQTIVLLTPTATALDSQSNAADPKQHEFPPFWPQKEDEVDYGSFKVKLIGETTLMRSEQSGAASQIVGRDFIMRSNQDDYELQTKIIHCPDWPQCCSQLSSVFELIQLVQQATQQQATRQKMHDGHYKSQTVTIGQEHEPQNGGPIIVVDKFGGTEAATFSVLTTLYKQINFEDAIDVYMYAKLAHLRRPGIWSSQDDYLFLYRAIQSYASILQEQQQQRQREQQHHHQGGAHSDANKLANPIFLANIHSNQTMTLDRHRHKNNSNSSANFLKSSTLRRPRPDQTTDQKSSQLYLSRGQPAANQAAAVAPFLQKQQQQHQQPIAGFQATTLEFGTTKSQRQLLPLDQNHNSIQYTRNYSTLGHSNMTPMSQQPAAGNMPKGSPYNSAASIGTGSSHQHLLAGSGPTGATPIGHQTNKNSNQTAPGYAAGDHYIYSTMQ